MENYFVTLYQVNVSDKIERKNGLSYVSWPYAWAEIKKRHPDATYTVYERPDGVIYWTDGRTCWVKTGLTVNGIEHIEYLPVMDFRNRSIPLEQITSMDINKAIQRSLTKAAARHGLGLYIYAGEDLPEEEAAQAVAQAKTESAEPWQVKKCKEFCASHNVTSAQMGAWRSQAINQNIIPAKSWADLSEPEFDKLIKFVEMHLNAGDA